MYIFQKKYTQYVKICAHVYVCICLQSNSHKHGVGTTTTYTKAKAPILNLDDPSRQCQTCMLKTSKDIASATFFLKNT